MDISNSGLLFDKENQKVTFFYLERGAYEHVEITAPCTPSGTGLFSVNLAQAAEKFSPIEMDMVLDAVDARKDLVATGYARSEPAPAARPAAVSPRISGPRAPVIV